MQFFSWNVNGIRAAIRKGFWDWFDSIDADLVCLQEVRADRDQVEIDLPCWSVHWNPAQQKGYSGTAILSRVPLVGVTCGIGIKKHDTEGRVITAELDDHFVVNVYTPNAQRGLARLDYRTRLWDAAFRRYLRRLEQRKPVVFCGDLNVAHREIDLARPNQNRGNAGFTDEERATFGKLLAAGFVDTFRHLCADGGHYTWWSNMGGARARNVGWRIDYFVISRALLPRLVAARIHPEVFGSDHCPISLELA